jgi:hypothetical protein
MNQLTNISVKQLKKVIRLKEKIEALETQLSALLGSETPSASTSPKKGRGMSAAGRRAVAAAQTARWAKVKGEVEKPEKKKRKKMSKAVRAKMAAAAKERWKKAKAAGKTRL